MAVSLFVCRTLTQEDPGDNQVTLEEITQMVRESKKCSGIKTTFYFLNDQRPVEML